MLLEHIRQTTKSRFFYRDKPPQNLWQMIAWWETRRIPYNFLVGIMGLVSGVFCIGTALVCDHYLHEPIGLPDPPFIAILMILFYGVMANVCYTGGWLVEYIVGKVWQEEGKTFGTISFTLGLVFSMLLTLLPGFLIVAVGAISLLIHAFGK